MEYILIADDNKDITDILEKYDKKEDYGCVDRHRWHSDGRAVSHISSAAMTAGCDDAGEGGYEVCRTDPTGIRRTDHFNYGTRRRL